MFAAVMLVRVLVLSPPAEPPPERFVELLGIQLSGIAEVTLGAALHGDNLPAKVEAAVDLADQSDATLAVWVERGASLEGSKIEFVLHVVGRREGRLMVEVFRLPARDGPALDRTLALKVGEVLDDILTPEATPDTAPPGSIETWVGPVEREPPPPTVTKPSESGGWMIEVGARGFGGIDAPNASVGAVLAGGAQFPLAGFDAEAYLALGVDSGADESTDDGAVATNELTGAAGARLLAPVGRVSLGAQLEAGARWVDADGETPFGTTGSERVLVPSVIAALEARLPLRSNFAARAAAGIEYSPTRVALTVNQQPVVDLGRVRAVAQLSLVFSMR